MGRVRKRQGGHLPIGGQRWGVLVGGRGGERSPCLQPWGQETGRHSGVSPQSPCNFAQSQRGRRAFLGSTKWLSSTFVGHHRRVTLKRLTVVPSSVPRLSTPLQGEQLCGPVPGPPKDA